MNRIDPTKRLSECHRVVGDIWRSRHQELEREVFDRFPRWMHQQEQPDHDVTFGLPVVMAQLLDTLRLHERKVIYLRFWCDATLNQIGNMCDLSQERIRQIESSALRKMKHPSRSDLLKDFY